MSGVNKFAGEGQGKIIMSSFPRKKVAPLPKKRVGPSDKVTPSEKVEKVTNLLNYIENPVYMIRRKDLDNFQGQYTVSIGWLIFIISSKK